MMGDAAAAAAFASTEGGPLVPPKGQGQGGVGVGKKAGLLSPLLERPPFEVRPMHISGPPHPYNAETDPNMPFTRTSKFKKHMGQYQQQMLSMSKSTSSLRQPTAMDMFSSSMVEMDRSLPDLRDAFPKTQVHNSSLPTGGVTFSLEPTNNAEESKCELDILKAVLNREGYLNRLERTVRTINKKFKPEIADVMDLVRAASIEVVECIVKWREAKKDHDAAFMWNQANYMLKMPSDLDYLNDYLAVRKWMGFSLIRNPFCVPYPLEEGAGMFADRVLNPKHIESGAQADGFTIGGISQTRLRNKYTPAASRGSSSQDEAAARSAGGSRSRSRGGQSAGGRESSQSPDRSGDRSGVTKEKPSPYQPPPGFMSSSNNSSVADLSGGGGGGSGSTGLPSSFILNSDMAKIRQAELVVLKEEEKFGRYARDPTGRVVPALQAFTRLAILELRKDDKRPIDQPSASITFAPHAKNSNIGVVDEPWLPEEKQADRFANHAMLRQIDDDANHIHRGHMTEGVLNPITLKGTVTRPRRPLRGNVGSALEFNRHRRKKTLNDRLSEISKLREEIKQQKEFLDSQRTKIKSAGKSEGKQRGRASISGSGSSSAAPGAAGTGGLGATSPPPSRGGTGRAVSRGSVSFSQDVLGSPPAQQTDPSASSLLDAISAVVTRGGEFEEKGGDEFGAGDEEQKATAPFSPPPSASDRSEYLLQKIRESEKNLVKQLEDLAEEDKEIRRNLDHIHKDESSTTSIKGMERLVSGSERSRDIERKRRLLSEEEGVYKGPPTMEDSNAYDYYAAKIQSTIRGWLTRCYTRWYRAAARRAASCIQACARGKLGRIKVALRRKRGHSATSIQKVYRGFKARNVSARLAQNKTLGKSCILIQKTYRGVLGRKRAKSKRRLDQAAEVARASVDPRAIYVSDVHELARRIQYAIEEPETSSYPPDEVLSLMRLCTVVMQQSRGNLGFSEYSFINARYYNEYDGEFLTWAQSVKMLNRAERMLKMMRAMAFGPASRPPRIISLSNNAQLMLAGYSASPNWKRSTFEEMGMGS